MKPSHSHPDRGPIGSGPAHKSGKASGKAIDMRHHGPVAPGSSLPHKDKDLTLPHERDESTGAASTGQSGSGTAGERQRELMGQAAADLAQGLVDTDLRSSPGIDAQKRRELVDTPQPAYGRRKP
ncbi:hypothetical protein ACS5PK_01415 [Roseateles sp. DB2]|uniref:hypothetical protein n=1 Tax=Roseateles sp. DB2 TaxID=3453717 RepID=UPI003EE99605